MQISQIFSPTHMKIPGPPLLKGIIGLVSCPQTLEQNGTAEGKHLYVVETGLTLMAHSSVPSNYWDKAFKTTIFFIYRQSSPNITKKSLFQILFNWPPYYRILNSVGCLSYTFLTPYTRYNLQYWLANYVFQGHRTSHFGYRCVNLYTGQIIISHHIIFDEYIFPFSTPSTPMSPLPQAPPILTFYPSPN